MAAITPGPVEFVPILRHERLENNVGSSPGSGSCLSYEGERAYAGGILFWRVSAFALCGGAQCR